VALARRMTWLKESDPGYRGPWLTQGVAALGTAPHPDLRRRAQALRQRAQEMFQENLRLQREIEAICLDAYQASPALRQALAQDPWPDPMPALPTDREMAAQAVDTALVDMHLAPRRQWPPDELAHCLEGRWLRAAARSPSVALDMGALRDTLRREGLDPDALQRLLGQDLGGYLRQSFWARHVQQYKRRPRVWLWLRGEQIMALPFSRLEQRRAEVDLPLPPPEVLQGLHSRDAWRQVFGRDVI
jgi:hypothetical protein